MSAPEGAEWFTFQRSFFILDKAKALPIRMGSQKAWQAIRLDFIDNEDKMIAKDYELHGRCDFLCCASRQNKGQKINKNVTFWHSLEGKPGFLILLINLKTGATQ